MPQRRLRKGATLILVAFYFAIGIMPAACVQAATVTWSGTGGTSWATGGSWSNSSGPGTGDTAAFTDTGATSIPGDVTSIVNTSRSIAGLSFNNTSTKFHTLDLNTKTLTLTGSVSFNLDQSALSTTTLRNGTLAMNSAFATFNVGRAASGSSKSIADLSGLTAFSGTLQDLYVGSSTANGATGTLTLSPSNNLTLQHIYVGTANSSGDVTGTLHLGLANTFSATEFDIGKDNGNGSVDIASGGTLSVGKSTARTLLQVGVQVLNSNNDYSGKLDISQGSLSGFFTSVIVGQKTGGAFGDANGILNGGTGGAIDIGAAGNTANFYVGRKLTGDNDSGASGTVDFSGANTLTANLNEFAVGTAQTGMASGSVKLAKASTIDANSITVGQGGSQTSTLTLGKTSNTLLTNSIIVGQSSASGNILVAPGATVTIGSAARHADISIGSGVANTNLDYGGKIDLTGTSLTAYLGDIIVGEKEGGGVGTNFGTFNGGNAGTIDIGTVARPAHFHVGHKFAGNDSHANGTVDFSGATTLTAKLSEFIIGTAVENSATGSVKLAKSNNITATSITVGQYNGSSGNLTLGSVSNTILTNSFVISDSVANGTVSVAPTATVAIGSAAERTSLSIGSGVANTNDSYGGKLDLTGTTFTGYLGDVIVGQKDGGAVGTNFGTFLASAHGSVDIGAPGNTANLYVGQKLNGNGQGGAVGTVDFGGLATLTASLNNLTVGTSLNGNASGTLTLAQSNNISANNIVIGSNGDGSSQLKLGKNNTILANQFNIGANQSGGSVTIPVGGTLNLGSPTQRTTLLIGTGDAITNNTYGGTLDLTNATLTAYLANVSLGMKISDAGFQQGIFTIGTSPSNYIEANNITMGGFRGIGTLNFGGGVLIANSIARGPGTATFNWTGGRLSVGTFGATTTSFNLNNNSTGTLAPGSASQQIGTTALYGNYTQGASASMAMDISASGNDLLAASGSISLNGTLTLNSLNGFQPTIGQNFLLASSASRTGNFSFIAPPKLPQDAAFQIDYSSPTQLYMRMVTPTTANYISPAPTGTWGIAGSWDTASIPTTSTATNVINNGAAPKIVTVASSTTVHRVNLQGASAASPISLEISQGVRFGVSNQLVTGPNATLTGAGTIIGDVVAGAGGLIAPGSSAAGPGVLQIAGNFNAQATSNVQVEIAGATAGSGYDQLAISGNASLSGNLAVKLLNGFSPAPLQRFDVLTYGSRSGAFTAPGPISAGGQLVFAPVYSADRLSLIATLPGDATVDGKVGFADLVALAQNYGSDHATWSSGDFNNNGVVSFDDLVTVAQHYGQGVVLPAAVPGASAEFDQAWAAAVAQAPEPSAAGLFVAIASLMTRRSNRAKRRGPPLRTALAPPC